MVTNGIRNIYLENNKIFVHDYEPYLKVFDAEIGKYLHNIGAKGQGPGELPYMYTVDINPHENKILLCWGNSAHRFDFDGNFSGKIELPPIDDNERINAPVVSIDARYFAGTIRTFDGDQKNLVVLFNDNQEITGSLKCYENPIQPPNIPGGVWAPFGQGGSFYRANQEIRYFRGFTDTVFAYRNETQMFSPFFIIDYGKHTSTLNFARGAENPNLIIVSSIKENDRYIFLNFHTENASPEPYEDEVYFDGSLRKFINHSISGIFDKQKQSFHFLRQPIHGIPGLKNDIDKGIPFFVRNTSSNNQLIDYHHAYKFLEYTESLPDLSDSFAEIINQISEEDNPIVIIAE
ncbi:6-bladed beta-propeller [Proteiniphilum acetatigenes]|uniref:6-bladed beta-propeller n=1 Tax=Proteiniphilum acetatigenes TaxID=294710 RepID=UPI0009DA3DF6